MLDAATLSFAYTVSADDQQAEASKFTRLPRLDEFVARRLPNLSLTRIRRLIEEHGVQVNGAASLKGCRLKLGDEVTVSLFAADKSAATPEAIPLDILYEDADLIVVNKPVGLLVHPSPQEQSGTLLNGLAYHFWQTCGAAVRPGLVHRLDRDTSGVIVIAKTPRAHRTLAKHFRERWVKKFYVALVRGVVAQDSGAIDAPIGSDETAWPKWRVLPPERGGRAAQTRYVVNQRFAEHTLLELEPLTGRTHQLRIHCALLGHPIVGDALYHGGKLDALAKTRRLKHQLLHAARLVCKHPATGQELDLRAPWPAEMREMVEQCAADC